MDCKSIQTSSSSQLTCKYDVFLSFRGKDTRNSFTDHLFGALQRGGIVTFKDDKSLKKGKSISPELRQAIEGSRISIVVFSKNYAASRWCLQELEKIVDCIKLTGQHVFPVFYDVSPSEARKQRGSFATAFAKHEERFKEDLEMVQKWRVALTQVADLSGWDLQNKPQYGEIEKIVQEVTSILGRKFSTIAGDLVGMHSPVEQLENLLVLRSNDVRVLGICGMGGIGKTTLATVLCDRISHQFDVYHFIDDVSRSYQDCGPVGVLKQLLCQSPNEENLQISNLFQASQLTRARLRHVKALVVLDNVTQAEQLERLAMNCEWLGAGSRIIIICRDMHILREYGADEVYNVQLLNKDEALQLFCRKAFKCDHITRDFEELTYHALEYAKGHPLAIKVLGSFLFGRNAFEWKSALTRLKENPKKEIMDVLRISFDGLEETEKEIFLDIACFLNYESMEYVNEFLDLCGFYPHIGIGVLIDKSLITIEWGFVRMHDLLKELGKKIVREKSPKEPGKWSRLWQYKDLRTVLLENTATENTEVIDVESEEEKDEILRADPLSKMSRLRWLRLHYVNFSGTLECLSNNLRYLYWNKYPFIRLPSSFQPDKLVELIMPSSSIKRLWNGLKALPKLKTIDLRDSIDLIKTPDFTGVPQLERLNLEGCIKLEQMDSSIGFLQKLAYLNLENCKSLMSLPSSILGLTSLEVLNLKGCSKALHHLSEEPLQEEHLKELGISETSVQSQLTSSKCKRLMLPFHFFDSRSHKASVILLSPSFTSAHCLQNLDLSFCNLRQVPDAIGRLHCLRRLNLAGNNFVTLPSSIKELSKLVCLHLEYCKQLKSLPELPSSTFPKPLPDDLEFYDVGLYIFICPKLADIEHCSSMAFSWMIRGIQECSGPLREIHIVIPGRAIPRWFNNQSVGDSISLEPSPNLYDNNWIGLAFCAAFVTRGGPISLNNVRSVSLSCLFTKENRVMALCIPLLLELNLFRCESDHLLVVYFHREQVIYYRRDLFFSNLRDGFKLEFDSAIYDHGERRPNQQLEMRNCGFRWVYKEDLEGLKPTTIMMTKECMSKYKKRKTSNELPAGQQKMRREDSGNKDRSTF